MGWRTLFTCHLVSFQRVYAFLLGTVESDETSLDSMSQQYLEI
jgi:hypothetical protein